MFFIPYLPDKRNFRARRWLRRIGEAKAKSSGPKPGEKKGLPHWAMFFTAPSSNWRILPRPAKGERPEEDDRDE